MGPSQATDFPSISLDSDTNFFLSTCIYVYLSDCIYVMVVALSSYHVVSMD